MSDAILVAMITSGVTLFGVILSNSKTAAVTNNEIKHLTEEVKKHNNFAQRIPVVEVQIEELTKRVEALEKRSLG
jgi:cell division protein FtsL